MSYEESNVFTVKNVVIMNDGVFIRSEDDEIYVLENDYLTKYKPLAVLLMPGDRIDVCCLSSIVKGGLDLKLYRANHIIDLKMLPAQKMDVKPAARKP